MDINKAYKSGKLDLRSRIVLPPMATEKSDEGLVTEDLCDYYKERAENPLIGLIITEHMFISMQGRASRGQLSIASDDVTEGLRRLTDTIHRAGDGIRVFAQINHAGGKADPSLTGAQPVSSSVCDFKYAQSRELSIDEIHSIADTFAEAAFRARKAGYDGVEIHSAHGYLLNQFYSPLVNKRADEYGASCMEDRLRFHKEVIEKVRAAVGEDYPIAVRLGGCDYQQGGSTEADAVEAAKLLIGYGADMIDVSGGMNGYIIAGHDYPGYFKDMSAAIKKAVNVPVITTGGVTKPEEAEELLSEGAADLIGVGRALYKDAGWGC
ncbi:MAG TPA: NADH:flavin oxidoreductase [Candidatus Avilachnospira avistercoris]|nr:NADH:flavin oxidoreductase [Candidatus Avilachnospira avistercoris]